MRTLLVLLPALLLLGPSSHRKLPRADLPGAVGGLPRGQTTATPDFVYVGGPLDIAPAHRNFPTESKSKPGRHGECWGPFGGGGD